MSASTLQMVVCSNKGKDTHKRGKSNSREGLTNANEDHLEALLLQRGQSHSVLPQPLIKNNLSEKKKKLHLSQLSPSVCIIHIKRMLASIILRCCEFQDIITSIIPQPLWQQYTDQYSYDTLVQTEWFYGHMCRYVLGYKWQIDPWFTSCGSQVYS